jgi:hypothetical protein
LVALEADDEINHLLLMNKMDPVAWNEAHGHLAPAFSQPLLEGCQEGCTRRCIGDGDPSQHSPGVKALPIPDRPSLLERVEGKQLDAFGPLPDPHDRLGQAIACRVESRLLF